MRKILSRIRFFRKINWIKTIYFNFKKFDFKVAKKLPVYFYGKVKFQNISGDFVIDAPIKRGMIGFGQPYEKRTAFAGTSEIAIEGKIVFKGHVQFGKDYFIHVAHNAFVEMGHMSSMASLGKIICTNSIKLGNYTRLGSECQIIDTNFHPMICTLTGKKFPLNGAVNLGNYNFISNRVTIMQNTVTPDFCTVASNTLCNKDYTLLVINTLIGGMPSKLLKSNITRDWDAEIKLLDEWLMVK